MRKLDPDVMRHIVALADELHTRQERRMKMPAQRLVDHQKSVDSMVRFLIRRIWPDDLSPRERYERLDDERFMREFEEALRLLPDWKPQQPTPPAEPPVVDAGPSPGSTSASARDTASNL